MAKERVIMQQFELQLAQVLRRGPTSKTRLRWEGLADLPDAILQPCLQAPALVIDMTDCSIVGHDGLVWLLAIQQVRQKHGLGYTYFRLPSDSRHVRYLQDLHFVQLAALMGATFLNEEVLWQGPGERRIRSNIPRDPHSPQYLQPITGTNWHLVLNAFSTHFRSVIIESLGFDSTTEEYYRHGLPFEQAIRELILNVVEHGGALEAEGSGFASYARWPRGYPLIRFVCNDAGLGFKESLQKKSSEPIGDELSALVAGLLFRYRRPQEGVFGLYYVLPLLRRMNGRLLIRSTNLFATLDLTSRANRAVFDEGFDLPTPEWVRRLLAVKRVGRVPGVHIAIDLSLPRNTHGRGH